MGFLTPVLIRNDALDLLKEDPKAIGEITNACNDPSPSSIGLSFYHKPPWWKFWKKPYRSSGGYANAMESLGARHSDMSRVFVVYGGTWVDLTDEVWKHNGEYDMLDEVKNHRTDQRHMNYLTTCTKIAKETVKQLEAILKEKKHVPVSHSKKNSKR